MVCFPRVELLWLSSSPRVSESFPPWRGRDQRRPPLQSSTDVLHHQYFHSFRRVVFMQRLSSESTFLTFLHAPISHGSSETLGFRARYLHHISPPPLSSPSEKDNQQPTTQISDCPAEAFLARRSHAPKCLLGTAAVDLPFFAPSETPSTLLGCNPDRRLSSIPTFLPFLASLFVFGPHSPPVSVGADGSEVRLSLTLFRTRLPRHEDHSGT